MSSNDNTNRDLYILHVDDEDELLETVATDIEQLGFSALTANSADEAEQLIKKHSGKIALIISDFKMPGRNGFELRKALLENYKEIPFVVLSGYVSREDALQAVELKISAFLEKPYDIERLKAVIDTESKDRISSIREDQELIEGFAQDSEVLCGETEGLLLSLEEDPNNSDSINRIFAIVHTIKGSSGFFKPDTLHRFTHKFEDYLSPFKKSGAPLDKHTMTVALKALDVIKMLSLELKTGRHESTDLDSLLTLFSEVKAPVETAATASSQENNAAAAPGKPPATAVEEIRIPIALLDEFMELSGEMTVIRNMIVKAVRAIEREMTGNKNIAQLADLMDEIHKINSLMQDKIVDLRKVPLKGIFRPLTRTMRDLSMNLKKDFILETTGDDLRVDTSIGEALNNSLIHLLRNSADHGIEPADIREQRKKPKKAKILVEATQKGEEIKISITDDGKGIDPEVIRNKAIEKNIHTAEALKSFSKAKILDIIFSSGFSTAAQVTDVSGRGVGMDMVKRSVTKVGGNIVIDSEVGRGTRFDITLPVPKSVMIIPSLLFKSTDETYAIPQDRVQRIMTIQKESFKEFIFNLEGADLLQLDGKLYPLVNISVYLNELNNQKSFMMSGSPEKLSIVLVKSDDREYGILVDEILDIEDTVVKKLGASFRNLNIFMGGTFLSDGMISLILDVNGISQKIGSEMKDSRNVQTNTGDSTALDVSAEDVGVLLFKLDSKTSYGIKLSEISRLEVFENSTIQMTGEQNVVLYQSKPMPLFSLRAMLGLGTAEDRNPSNVIVIKNDDEHYYGLTVNELSDLLLIPVSIDTSIADRALIKGNCIIDGKTIPMINTEEVIRQIHEKIQNFSTENAVYIEEPIVDTEDLKAA